MVVVFVVVTIKVDAVCLADVLLSGVSVVKQYN
jgi:hypothetical protein